MEHPQRLVMAMATEKGNKRRTGFIFNSASGFVQFILTAILIFVSFPVFINRLGEVSFGIFSTISVIGNLSLFANLSLESALVKFLAEQGKTKESNYDICIALSIMLVILVPLSILVYIFRMPILSDVLNIPIEHLAEGAVLMECMLVSNGLLIVGKIFASILDSQHKVYLSNLTMFIYNALYWGGIISVILLGYALEEVGLAILLATVLWFVLIIVLAFKEWGRLDISGIRANFRRIVKKQLFYTSKIYMSSLLGMFFEPLTKVLIANFAGGVVMVGFYEIGLRVKGQFTTLFFKLLYPLYPIVAHEKSKEKVAAFTNKITHGMCFVVLPVVVLVTFGAKSFLSLWLGAENTNQYTILSVIVLTNSAMLFSVLVMPIFHYVRAKNHAGKEIYIQGLNIIVNTAVILLAYRSLGFYSALLANALAFFSSFCLCLYLQNKYLKFRLLGSVSGVVKFIIYGISITIAAWGVHSSLQEGQILYLLVLTFGVLSVGAIMGYVLKVFTKENINIIRNL